MPGFSRQERLGINLAQNATIPILTRTPSTYEGSDGDRRIVKSLSGQGPRLYIKSEGRWWYSEFLPTSASAIKEKTRTLNVRDEIKIDSGRFSMGEAYHRFAADVPIRSTYKVADTIMVQIPGLKFPAKSHIILAAAMIKELGNPLTLTCTLQLSETAGTAPGAAISSGTELLGGSGITKVDSGGSDIIYRPQNTSYNVLNSSGSLIQLGSANDLNEVFTNNTPYFHDSANDFYAYLCNGGQSGGIEALAADMDNSTDPITFGVSFTQRWRVGEIFEIGNDADAEQLLITVISATSGSGNITASRAAGGTDIDSHSLGDTCYTLTPSSGMVTVMFDYIGSF